MSSTLWQPSNRCRKWLLIGIFALLADLLAGVVATVLEFRNWGEEGFTPDVVLSYAAIIPQIIIITSYLVLARECGARGLWKSVGGMAGSYLLMCLIGLVMLEVLPDIGNVAIMAIAALGLVGLIGFSVSGIPRFSSLAETNSSPPESAQDPEPSAKLGCLGYLVGFIVLVAVRGVMRRFIGPFFRGFAIDDWVLLEFLAIGLFGLSFAIWFAVTKIRLRAQLGSMACVLGITEIVILIIHAGLAVLIFAAIISEAAANPQLDDAGIDRLLDPWMKRGSLVSAACHVIWVVVTAAFFASLQQRSENDAAQYEANTSLP
jgi:hypothetical protein